MIESFQVSQESWPEFFVTFSADNQGRKVGIEVIDEETGEERLTKAASLLAVGYDPEGKGNDIVIATGHDAVDYTHTIVAPTEVWEEEDDNGNIVSLEITDQSGVRTVLNVKS
ncbi:MAG TPA: DUF5335 family protein [Thermoguttaceae bacterium]|nr:DUF5335 family protein [Thermoguttaceae bacterium]